jgi:putative ABC transport system permease protein
VNGARRVAVVNQTLVNRYFGQEDPIGRQIKFKLLEKQEPIENPVFEIIGVVSDAKNQGIQDPPSPEAFIPYTVTGAFERGILARARGNPEALIDRVKREVWAVDRGVAITLTGSLSGYLTQFSYATPRFSVVLLGVFATVGLVLVAIGVYSVIAYTVSQQTHEIGIRMALGAAPVHVLRLVGLMGLRLVAIGAAIGLAGSFAATRLIAAELVATSQHDPLTLTAVVVTIVLVGLAACYFPARRATRVDPLIALRG